MKINFLTKLIGVSCFLCSCGSEIKTFKITVYSKGPLVGNMSESNLNQLNQIKQTIPKFETNGIQFVCKSADFVRLDLDSAGKIETRHSTANNIKIKMGVELSAEDLLNDYQDSTNIEFPGFLNDPKGTSNSEFPKDCIFISNLDSLDIIIQQNVEASTEEVNINIGILQVDHNKSTQFISEEQIIPPPQEIVSIPNVQLKKETINTSAKNTNLPKLRINLEVTDDQRELTWYNNSKKSQTSVNYEIIILKNNKQIVSKKNIISNKISCADLNSSKLLNIDCEYKLQINAIRTDDGMLYSEVYDIELLSPDKFTPRCHLNLLND